MAQTRKLVRETMRTALADAVAGFNAKLAAIAVDYDITPFTLNWAPSESPNFLQSFADQEAESRSRLLRDIHAVLYTSGSTQTASGRRSKSATFEGIIRAHLDFTVQFHDGEDITADMTEDYADAIEDVILQIFLDPHAAYAPALREGPLYYGGDFACQRGPIQQTEDGYSQRLPFTFLYEVHV